MDLLAVTDSTSSYSSGDVAATFAGLGILLVIGLVFYLIASFLLYKIFEKAGRPGWAGFVPIYNMWVLFEISGKPGWWALLVLLSVIPIVGFFVSIAWFVLTLLASLELAKRFGKSTVFAVFGLWLFSIIGYAILAFDDSKYHAAGTPSVSGNDPNKTPEVFANNKPDDTNPPQNPPNLVQ